MRSKAWFIVWLRSPNAYWWMALTICMWFFIDGFYGHILHAPDAVVLSGNGDGLKNYFTLLWHANHDSSWLGYSGSNYPFGERVFYTDGHPLLSWILQCIPSLAPHAVGVLNTLLVVGLLFCAWVLYALLRELKVTPWAAAVGAFSITVLQPQIFRMGGHYSLAHPWFIPLFMLTTVRLHGRVRWLRPAVIAIVAVLVAFLTHPYLGLMGTMLFLAHGFCRFLLGPHGWHTLRATLVRTLFAALPPMLLFLLVLGIGDSVQDRPVGPMGADVFATRFLSLILPTDDPFATPLREFVNYGNLQWETWCYLGLSPILVLVIAGGIQLQRWTRKQPPVRTDDAGSLLAASFLVLLFAMGVWQEWLNGEFPMLEQFRGTGRFAWAIFFASAVFCVVRVHHWLLMSSDRRKVIAPIAYIVVVGFMAVEGWAYHKNTSNAFGHAPNPFRTSAMNDEQRALVKSITGSGANAILPLPWMHTGSERYAWHAPNAQLGFILPIAYHSGVPLMAGITSRASLQQSRDHFAVFAPSYFPKNLRAHVPGAARILLIRHWDPLSHAEEEVWSRAGHVYNNAEGNIREISSAQLLPDDRKQRLSWYEAMRDQLHSNGPWQFSSGDTAAPEHLVMHARSGADGLAGIVEDYTDLIAFLPGELDTSTTYELSFQYSAPDPTDLNNNAILIQSAADGSDGKWEELHGMRTMPMQLGDGMAVASIVFKPRYAHRAYKFLMNGPAKRSTPYEVGHVLLRPLGLDAWREGLWGGRKTVFLNNVPLTSDTPAAIP